MTSKSKKSVYEWIARGGISRCILEQRGLQELIRCRDCKYAHMTVNGHCKYCDMWKDDNDLNIELYVDGDFFCGYAKSKDE